MKKSSPSEAELLTVADQIRSVAADLITDTQGLALLNGMKEEIYPEIYEYASSLGQQSFGK